MRVFETTGELALFAALLTVLDLMLSIYVALSGAHIYMDSAPILALYATEAAVTAKTFASVFLLALFVLVKHRALRTPRRDKIIRAALYAYLTFVYASFVTLVATLEPPSTLPTISTQAL